jgi:NAD(P)-dependent dehydrogenase (short-subunit alcohol dehydrogenase family)
MEVFNFTNWPSIRDFVTTLHHDSYDYISPVKADLSEKSVFIAVATRGIGKSIASSFARAGCSRIALGGRGDLSAVETEVLGAAQEAGRHAPEVLKIKVDISSEESVAVATSQIATAFGGVLDILINVAGVVHRMVPLTDSDPEEWWKSWEVNVKGVYLCTRALIPLILKSSLRTIITVSTAGAHMLTPGLDGYQTGKFALCRLTEFIEDQYRA